MKRKLIQFDETKYRALEMSLNNNCNLFNTFYSEYLKFNLGSLDNDGIRKLLKDPSLFIADKVTQRVNSQSGTILGFKVKMARIFDFVEEPANYQSVIDFYNQKIRALAPFSILEKFDFKSGKFQIKESALDEIKEASSRYIVNEDQEKAFDAYSKILDGIKSLHSLMPDHIDPRDLFHIIKKDIGSKEYTLDVNSVLIRFNEDPTSI